MNPENRAKAPRILIVEDFSRVAACTRSEQCVRYSGLTRTEDDALRVRGVYGWGGGGGSDVMGTGDVMMVMQRERGT